MKIYMKVILVVSLFVMPLIAGTATQVVASGPNPGMGNEERIIGPATEGIVYMEFVETDSTKCTDNGSLWAPCYIATVVGACQKQSIVLRFSENISLDDFKAIPEEYLLGFSVDGISPPGCYSEEGGEELIITGVSKFNNTSTTIETPNYEMLEIYAIGARVSISVIELK